MVVKPEDEVPTHIPINREDSIGDGMLKSIGKDADVALHFTSGGAIFIDETTDKRIRSTIDWHIMPWMFALYTLQYIDKVSLSFAVVMGARSDLGINAVQYPW